MDPGLTRSENTMKQTLIYALVGVLLASSAALGQGSPQRAGAQFGPRQPRANPSLRVSVDSVGGEADNYSFGGAPSADARFIAFGSLAGNLVPGDSNGASDVFLRDGISGLVTVVSADANGNPGNAESYCYEGCISADGRFVLFGSAASDLVPGDTNGARDVFVRDLLTSTTTRVSLDSEGLQLFGTCWPDCISANGMVVAFTSALDGVVPEDANGIEDVFVHDTLTGTTERVSVSSAGIGADAISQSPSLSGDGRYVVFSSWSTNLVASDANAVTDVFLRDRLLEQTTLVSVASSGAQGDAASFSPFITPDGRYVALASYASNLVPGDANAECDIFVKDLTTGVVMLASVATSGAQGNGGSVAPSLSSDGRFVGFQSIADNFWPVDTNLCADGFVHDLITGTTWLATADEFQTLGNDFSGGAIVSADGRFVTFESHSSNLVSDDTNLVPDVFLRQIKR